MARQTCLSFTVSRGLLKLMSIELVMSFNHPILCRLLLLLHSVLPSIGVFSNEWALSIRGPKYWNFSFSVSPSNEYSGLIFFRTDLFVSVNCKATFTWQGRCGGSVRWGPWTGSVGVGEVGEGGSSSAHDRSGRS